MVVFTISRTVIYKIYLKVTDIKKYMHVLLLHLYSALHSYRITAPYLLEDHSVPIENVLN